MLQNLLFPHTSHALDWKQCSREVLEPGHLKFWESQGLQAGTSIRAGLFEKTDSWAHIYTGSLFSTPSKLELEVKLFYNLQHMCISIGRAQTSTLKDFLPQSVPYMECCALSVLTQVKFTWWHWTLINIHIMVHLRLCNFLSRRNRSLQYNENTSCAVNRSIRSTIRLLFQGTVFFLVILHKRYNHKGKETTFVEIERHQKVCL